MYLTVVSTISLSSNPLPKNMRIPNTAEFIAFFVTGTTGQLTGFSNERKIDIILFMISTRLTGWFSFHIAAADLNSKALAPACDSNRPLFKFKVEDGDTCDRIGMITLAPTLVSL